MSIPAGKSRKLVNKYIGPVKISDVIVKGTTSRVELPNELRRRGIKPTFHALLLKPHIPYKDCRFPRHDYQQFVSLEGNEDQWSVERITNHHGQGNRAMFEILWHGGEVTWEPYKAIKHLEALWQYFEAQGVTRTSQLPLKDDFVISKSENNELGTEEGMDRQEKDSQPKMLSVAGLQVLKSKWERSWKTTPQSIRSATLNGHTSDLQCLTTDTLATTAPADDKTVTPMSAAVCSTTLPKPAWLPPRPLLPSIKPTLSMPKPPLEVRESIVDTVGAPVDAMLNPQRTTTTSQMMMTCQSPLVNLNLDNPDFQFLGICLGQDLGLDDDEDKAHPQRIPTLPREPALIPPLANPAPIPAPQVPQIDPDLLREMEYHADLLTERMSKSLQAVDKILKVSWDMEDQNLFPW